MGNRRDSNNVLGESRNRCRRCFERCEDALEFVEDIKELLDEFFEDNQKNPCGCCNKNNRDNYFGRGL